MGVGINENHYFYQKVLRLFILINGLDTLMICIIEQKPHKRVQNLRLFFIERVGFKNQFIYILINVLFSL